MDVTYEHRLTELEGKTARNEGRIKDLEERQNNLDKLATSVSLLAEREERVEGDVKEIKADVKALAQKPAKRWDSLTNQIITIAVAAIMGFIVAKFGL